MLSSLSVEDRTRLLNAAADVFDPDPVQRRRYTKEKRKQERAASIREDEAKLADTGIRVLREKPVFTTPNVYPPRDFEPARRAQRRASDGGRAALLRLQGAIPGAPSLLRPALPAVRGVQLRQALRDRRPRGRVAVLTGGRVKIGYQAGIKLLRAGAHLVVTTRFPRDSAARYAQEPDFADWSDRLEIYGLDLRHTPSVEAFCRHLQATHDRLDYIVNNACQTVRRPPDFYRHMMDAELASEHTLPAERAAPARRLLGVAALRHARERRPGPRRLRARRAGADARPRRCRRCDCCPRSRTTRATSFPRAGSIRTCSRSISATATRGASSSPRSPPSSSSRRSSSTRSRRSSSTRA